MWVKITYERLSLFEKVWATPVKTLAAEFGLSDVGLRKICDKLDVPLPPRGYRAKVAAGKTTTIPQLNETTVPATYERVINVVKVDAELEERITEARIVVSTNGVEEAEDYVSPRDTKGFLPQAKWAARAMKGAKPVDGAITVRGVTWADVSTSENLKARALLLMDRFAHELDVLGARFENSNPPLPPLHHGARHDFGRRRN